MFLIVIIKTRQIKTRNMNCINECINMNCNNIITMKHLKFINK